MSNRPGFLTVKYGGSGLETMGYEKKMVRDNDVKFNNEDGMFELTDVRLVWYRKPGGDRGTKLKKFGALAGAIAGAAVLDSVGSSIGGFGGRAVRSVGHGIAGAAVYSAISSWTADNFYNKDANGNTESLAVPLVAVETAAQSGNNLVVELKSGGNMVFAFKQNRMIPSIIANIAQAQQAGKCPYCGANAGRAATCPKCGGPIDTSGGGSGERYEAEEGPQSGTVRFSGQGAEGGPDDVTVTFGSSGGGRAIHYDVSSKGTSGGKFCMNCGTQLPADAKFCNKCGQRV